jgi:hypothetical protein
MAAVLLLAAACFFQYRSGCVFDGKQGAGDAALARHYDSVTNGLVIAELVCLMAAVLVIAQRGLQQRLAMATLALMLAAPISVYLMLEANTRVFGCERSDLRMSPTALRAVAMR